MLVQEHVSRAIWLNQLNMAVGHFAWSVAEWNRQRGESSFDESAKFHAWVVEPARMECLCLRDAFGKRVAVTLPVRRNDELRPAPIDGHCRLQ